MKKDFIKKAVGLQYKKDIDNAPKVTVSGKRETAKKIIKIAQENNIPIKKDEDLVNMLSQIELNQEIPTVLYKAVAEIFSYVYSVSNEKDDKNEKTDI